MEQAYRPTEPITRVHNVVQMPRRSKLEQDIMDIKRDIHRIKTVHMIRITVEIILAFTIIIALLYLMHEVSILMAPVPHAVQLACNPAHSIC